MSKLTAERKSFWRTEIADIVLMLAFVGVVQLFAPTLSGKLPESVQLPLGIALAVIPAVLWISVFYAQDRVEPEPRHFVIGVAILAGLLAAAVGQPLLNGLFRVSSWIHRDTVTELLGSILVIGIVQEVLKFAAVRFSVFHSQEFDQRVDGVLYGTAAGVGYATMLNLSAVLAASGFADIGAGVVRIVITALAHGAVGGLTGYFLASDKFDRKPAWWLPLGVLLAAVINGAFSWLRGEISQSALTLDATGTSTAGYNALPALLLSAVVAIAVFALVFALMRRANAKAEPREVSDRDTLSAVIVFAVAALAVIAGLLMRNGVEARVKAYADPSGVQIAYPESWRLDTRRAIDGMLRVRDTQSDGYPATFEVSWAAIDPKLDDESAVSNAASNLALNRARDLSAYKTFDLTMTPNTATTATSSFVFVANQGGALQESVPVVVLGEDRFVRKGDKVYVFSMQTTEAGREQAQAQFERFVSSAVLP